MLCILGYISYVILACYTLYCYILCRLENRQQLVTSCHMGPKVFINCAGFVKIDTTALGQYYYYFYYFYYYYLIKNHGFSHILYHSA